MLLTHLLHEQRLDLHCADDWTGDRNGDDALLRAVAPGGGTMANQHRRLNPPIVEAISFLSRHSSEMRGIGWGGGAGDRWATWMPASRNSG